MVPNPGTPLRAHRLRPLNRPRRVFVELNERGLPIAMLTGGRSDGQTGAGVRRRQVEAIGEVWRVDDEGWGETILRGYFEGMLEGGEHTGLYEDKHTREGVEQNN